MRSILPFISRFLPPASCLLALFLAASCSQRETPVQEGRRSQTLLLGNGAEPADLDPHLATALTDMNILACLFEGLTVLDEASSLPLPGAAQRWEPSADGLTWTFQLRDDARWSDGSPLLAEDFVFSFRRLVSPKLAAEYAYLLWPLKHARSINEGQIKDLSLLGVRASGPRTLELQLESPCPWLPTLVANAAWYPVSRAAIERHGAWDRRDSAWTLPGRLIGNGPYVLKEWRPNARLSVSRNPFYWDNAQTGPAEIVFYPNENLASEERNFRTGQLHVTYDLLPGKIESYRKEAPGSLRIDPFLETFLLRFNTTRAPLSDPRVRRALALAIDRGSLCSTVLRGSRTPARSLTPPAIPGYEPPSGPGFDPEEARRLLSEAGYPGGKGFPLLEAQLKSDDIHRNVMETVQQMWRKELGVSINLSPLEQKTWLANQAALSYDISSWRWVGDFLDANTFLDLWITTSGKNQTGWSNSDYDRLVTLAAGTMNDAQRHTLQSQAEAILLSDAPIAPLFHGTRVYLLHPSVKNWPPAVLGIRRYQFVRLE